MIEIVGFIIKLDIYIITFLTTLLWLSVFEGSVHMFQLNSYRNDTHFKWLTKKTNNLLNIYFGSKTKAKKPLVYTHRVIRMIATALVVYFGIALVLVYTGAYLAMPVLVLFSPFFPILANIINTPLEKINNNRYINDAKKIINECPDLITIGITGSYGKTSTKFYLNKLLSAKYNVLMTPESYNTTLGVVKTIRNDLRPTHEVFICEMGMKWQGDIAEICSIVKPKHAVITSIGAQHLESMKTIENIIKEKFSITDSITDGFCFLNEDNEYIRETKIDKNIIRYGISHSEVDYEARDISISEKGTNFTVYTPDGESAVFETSLIGSHNVQNIVAAIAVSHSLGIGMNEIILPVKRLEPAPHRLQIKSAGNTTIIDDSFNSNPAGAEAALDTLKILSENTGGTKILITPGMVELGDKSYDLNKSFGKQASTSCDYALLIGKDQAVPIKEGLLESGFPEDKIRIFNSFNEGMAFANGLRTENQKKIILIENDLPDNY
ncbi:MAG: UDP-N-acetylmuramoyl-tripeptide--D-alanyl-D-alanine ligase [Oscillospiraceae bacterium]|nr:UDP-N-acetylmuramoyl-tripeptide--D-alanyl-D-alanine ligase [Oscillospiraceae bacterium]